MTYDDLYGWARRDLDDARAIVQEALEIEMSPHDSLHYGGDYYRYDDPTGEEFILQGNEQDWPPEPAEPEFIDYRVLLRVEDTARPCEIARRLRSADPQITLLRRREIRPPGEYDPGTIFPEDCAQEIG